MFAQGEWKIKQISAQYRLRTTDPRFEEVKNYSSELQTHINSILKIRAVSRRQMSPSALHR